MYSTNRTNHGEQRKRPKTTHQISRKRQRDPPAFHTPHPSHPPHPLILPMNECLGVDKSERERETKWLWLARGVTVRPAISRRTSHMRAFSAVPFDLVASSPPPFAVHCSSSCDGSRRSSCACLPALHCVPEERASKRAPCAPKRGIPPRGNVHFLHVITVTIPST